MQRAERLREVFGAPAGRSTSESGAKSRVGWWGRSARVWRSSRWVGLSVMRA
jgi:hypothetical protein